MRIHQATTTLCDVTACVTPVKGLTAVLCVTTPPYKPSRSSLTCDPNTRTAQRWRQPPQRLERRPSTRASSVAIRRSITRAGCTTSSNNMVAIIPTQHPSRLPPQTNYSCLSFRITIVGLTASTFLSTPTPMTAIVMPKLLAALPVGRSNKLSPSQSTTGLPISTVCDIY